VAAWTVTEKKVFKFGKGILFEINVPQEDQHHVSFWVLLKVLKVIMCSKKGGSEIPTPVNRFFNLFFLL
jgi:hypothetical protein